MARNWLLREVDRLQVDWTLLQPDRLGSSDHHFLQPACLLPSYQTACVSSFTTQTTWVTLVSSQTTWVTMVSTQTLVTLVSTQTTLVSTNQTIWVTL